MREEWNVNKQKVICNDCVEEMRSMPEQSVDVVVTSPPYNLDIQYNTYEDNLDPSDYWRWIYVVFKTIYRVLKDDGSFFLNVGSTCKYPSFAMDVCKIAQNAGWVLQNNIIWVKSITVNDISVGHFKPINSPRFLNDQHENIFHFTKTGNVSIQRLAIGVKYADKCLSAETMMLAKINDVISCASLSSLYKSYKLGKTIFLPSYDFETQQAIWTKLINFSEPIIQEVKELKLRGGINVVASANHRFPIHKRNSRAGKDVLSCLTVDEIIVRQEKWKSLISLYYAQDLSSLILSQESKLYNYETGYVLGLYLAEGYPFGKHAFRFAANEIEWDDDKFGIFLRHYFKTYFGKKVKKYKAKDTNGIQLQIDYNVFRSIISQFIDGDSALTKSINIKECVKYGANFLRGIIDGFLVGDGSYKDGYDYYAVGICNNKKLTREIRTCCLLIGYEFKQNKTTINIAPDGKPHKRINFWIRKYCNGGKRLPRTNGLYLERLVSIKNHEHKGKKELITYDVEVDNVSNLFFLANGLMTHNSNIGRYADKDLRCRGNVWFLPYKTTQKKKQHPAGFPAELPEQCIKLHGIRDDMVVLDPFLGAGTTLLACEKLNVNGIGVELDQQYCELAVNNLKKE